MKNSNFARLAAYFLVMVLLHAVPLPAQLTTSAPVTEADREKALDAIFADIWEDRLKHDPEFASSLGDKRYDDQLSDYSVAGLTLSWLVGARISRS